MPASKLALDIRRLYYGGHPEGCSCGCSSSFILNLAAGEEPVERLIDINLLFNRALKNIYKKYGGKQDLVDSNLFEITNRPLQQAITKTFNKVGVEFGKTNAAFIQEFKTNARVFAAFKNHIQGKEIASLLINEKGTLRSFSEFKREALKISEGYNKTWLQTEYNTAVRSARMAANYKHFQSTKDIYPNLEYMPSTSASPRDSHKALWGTIKPIDDPFWSLYLPPSDWNCKCSVRATKSDVVDPPDALPDISPVFRNNPAKTASFINLQQHPYYKLTDPLLRKEIARFALPSKVAQGPDLNSQRESIRTWAKSSLLSHIITVSINDQQRKVSFTLKGIKKALDQPHRYLAIKNEAIRNIEELLSAAVYVKSATDTGGNENFIFHYFRITINNETSWIVLKETLKERRIVFYSIVDKIKE